MSRASVSTILALLLTAASAKAADLPRTLLVQGTLETSAGSPATGPLDMEIRLYPTSDAQSYIYTQLLTGVPVEGGVFDATLGPLPGGLLEDNAELWVEAVVAGKKLDRRPLRSVPWSLVSMQANVSLSAKALDCKDCVTPDHVIFPFAISGSKGGAATQLECGGCVDPTDLAPGAVATDRIQDGAVTSDKVSFDYAAGDKPNGAATDVHCARCVEDADLAIGLGCRSGTDRNYLAFCRTRAHSVTLLS